MITARSSIVNMPPGHYDKISQVIRSLIHNSRWRNRGTKSYRRPPKRTRPDREGHEYHPRKVVRLADEWKRLMEAEDPDGLTELWSR